MTSLSHSGFFRMAPDSPESRVAIVGAAGYTGEELLRLLIHHPRVQITCITSRGNAGTPVGDVFPRLSGADLAFAEPDVANLAAVAEIAFLALPHGLAAEFAVPLLDAGLKVFDISADFRLKDIVDYKTYYNAEHPAPELLARRVYGLPELRREALRTAELVACPGCYPTSIIIPVAPLLKAGVAAVSNIVACSMSGVTGAGRKVETPYLFAECNESVRAYSVTRHRHLPEIEQELAESAGVDSMRINFIPHLLPMNRGILSTITLDAEDDELAVETIAETLRRQYGGEPFVRVLPHGKLADTKNVVFTNVCEISFDFDPRNRKIIVSSAADNLTKGAAGQAVQCMNIACGFDETAGLL